MGRDGPVERNGLGDVSPWDARRAAQGSPGAAAPGAFWELLTARKVPRRRPWKGRRCAAPCPGCRRPPRWQPLSSRRGFGCSGTNHRTLHERPLTRHGPMRASAPTKRAEQTAISNHRALREKPLRGTDARCAPLRKKSRLGCVDRGYYGGASAGRCGHRPLQRPRGRNASHNLRFGI